MQTNVILFGVAVALAVPTTITILNERGSFTQYDEVPRLFPGFTGDNIHWVVLTREAGGEDGDLTEPAAGEPGAEKKVEQLVLVRQNDRWVLGEVQGRPSELAGAPVLKTKVENDILEHVKSIRRDERALVQANADEEAMRRRGLTADSGILIECLNVQRESRAQLYRGHDASGGNYAQESVKGFFVARKGRNDVILYEPRSPYWALSLDGKDWVDTTIHDFQADQVQSFSIRNPKGEVTFVRAAEKDGKPSTEWKVESGPENVGAIHQAEVARLLGRFQRVNCARYLGQVGNPQLAAKVPTAENAEYVVSAVLKDGTRHTMWVGGKIEDKAEHYARFEGKDGPGRFLVAIGDWVRSPFEKDPVELFGPPPEAVVAPPKDGAGDAGKEPEEPDEGGAGGKGEAPPGAGEKTPPGGKQGGP